MSFFRVHSAEIALRTQCPRGVFTAVGRLVEALLLNETEVKLYWETRRYFEEILPVPPFYADGNPERAIVWFKDSDCARDVFAQMSFYFDMAKKYELPLYVTRTTQAPGRVIYEDDYQLAVADSLHAGAGFLTYPLIRD